MTKRFSNVADFVAIAILLGIVSVVLTSQFRHKKHPSLTIQPPAKVSLADDFVMGDPWAVSNAVAFQAPPKDWEIVCDNAGHFAPRTPRGSVCDIKSSHTVRTSRFEAIVAAWRVKGILDNPPVFNEPERETNIWTNCDK